MKISSSLIEWQMLHIVTLRMRRERLSCTDLNDTPGHLDTSFSWFPCVYKQMLRWFPTFQVATTCFSCSTPDLKLVVTNFMFCLHVK